MRVEDGAGVIVGKGPIGGGFLEFVRGGGVCEAPGPGLNIGDNFRERKVEA